MRTLSSLLLISLSCVEIATAQGRPIDWPSYGGNAQRSGWQKSDSRITKENVKEFQLVLKRKLDNPQAGARSLTPPVVIGNLISYRGFKELAFVADSSGHVWSIDADLDRIFWHKQLGTDKAQAGNRSCSAGLTAIPALTPPMNFTAGRPPRGAAGSQPPITAPPTSAATPAPPTGRISATGFGSSRPVFVLAGDGRLHQLNSATGEDQFPPLEFVPAGSKASSLALQSGVLYTTSNASCGGTQNGVWAVNLTEANPKPVSFTFSGGSIGGLGGFALGNDGTVYVQTGAGQSDPASGKWAETLLALTPKDLKPKQYFKAPGSGSVTPVVFTWKEKELVVSAGKNGSLFLLDAQTLGGDDHKTALYETAPISSAGIWGGLSTWEDADGTRWVLAPVWGALASNLKSLTTNGNAPHGSIVAFKLEEHDGKPMLTPAWVSRDMSSPEPPVITSGVVFAVSAGEYTRDQRPVGSSHAVLYALDGATGKEMYSTGNQVTAPANLTGVTVANGRVYFTTTDNTLYAFGIFLER
jgi:outer membrane protein assembly factor BamB